MVTQRLPAIERRMTKSVTKVIAHAPKSLPIRKNLHTLGVCPAGAPESNPGYLSKLLKPLALPYDSGKAGKADMCALFGSGSGR